MTRRTVGWAMVAVGAILIIVGAVSLLASSGTEQAAGQGTTTTTSTASSSTTTLQTKPTSTVTPTTQTPTSTTSASSTTTPPPSVAEFVAAYATALEEADAGFLVGSLLPELTEAFGSDLCRAWVAREILGLSDYRLTGDITGPSQRTLSVGDAAIPVENYYEAPVSFTFQNQSFDAMAAWVVTGDRVFWVGECR
jgi:hypothetical protein